MATTPPNVRHDFSPPSFTTMKNYQCIAILLCLCFGIAKAQDDPVCPFECFHDSVCAEGVADFSDHPEPNGQPLDFHEEVARGGKHCACPTGYTGLRCARQFETCNDGLHFCYHGGACIPGLEDEYGNEQLFCNCEDAVDEHGVKYVGKYCELPAETQCGDSTELFCVNGGYCKEDYMDAPHRPCRCGPDHDGPHCEFAKGAVPECTLDCHNGGVCNVGIRSFVEGDSYLQWSNYTNYQYCDCPVGFYGPQCDIPSSKCGEHHCFNGGVCVTKRGAGGITKEHCDCNAAHTDAVSYGGRYCQYESTTFCAQNIDENGQLFCVNDGDCREQGAHLGCDCPDGYHGPICEFHDDEQNVEYNGENYEDCTLQCQNGGQCRKGVKDLAFLNNLGPQVAHMNVSHSEDFEHCVCPNGYVGLKCEHTVDLCGGGDHACFHGSKCVDSGGTFECDCTAGFSSFEKLAGKFCEHKSTTICTESGEIGLGKNNLAFCVNNGMCKGIADETTGHLGCNCPDDFEGPHCEIVKSILEPWIDEHSPNNQPPPVPLEEGKSGGSGVTLILLVVAMVGCVIGAVGFVVLYRRKKKMRQFETEQAVIHAVPPAQSMSVRPQTLALPAPVDWEENQMVNVEIL